MKKIKTFEQFLNEAYSPNSTENIISSLFNKAGFDDLNSSKFNGGISIGVDLDKFEGVEKSNTPKEITKLQKLIRSWSDKNDGVLVMKTSLGYSSGNGFTVTLADSPIKVNKVYHKTSRKNVESILKDGMMSTKAHGHSDTFGSGLSRSNNTEQLYRATFGVTTKSNAKKLSNYFKFTDPVILEINAKSYTWYQDPLMPPDMKSVFSYDSIKPEDIKIQE
jgi:hypothetical protein